MIKYLRNVQPAPHAESILRGTTEYAAIGKPLEGDTLARHYAAIVSVEHPDIWTNFYNRDKHGMEVSPSWMFDDHGAQERYGDYPDPETLFSVKPGNYVTAFAHPNMRHAVPMLLAMAHRELSPLTADRNLSHFSSRLAKRGLQSGLIIPNPRNVHAEQINNHDFSDTLSTTWMPGWDWTNNRAADNLGSIMGVKFDLDKHTVPENDLHLAKSHLRRILGRDKEREHDLAPFFGERLPGI
jgi:hypothetical protein